MAQNLFGTVLALTLGSGDNNTILTGLALGKTTLIEVTLTANVGLRGLEAFGGNVDGMVVTLQNVSTGFSLSAVHDTGTPSTDRFLNAGLSTVSAAGSGTGLGALTFRYDGTRQRWMHLGSA